MKTPNEHAHALFAFFFTSIDGEYSETIAKMFSTRLVNEVLKVTEHTQEQFDYYQQVKQEIEKL